MDFPGYHTSYLICNEDSKKLPKQLRKTQHGEYTIFSYDPSILSFDNEDARLYTSVVVDASLNKAVAYSMPKPCDITFLEPTMNDEAGNTFHFEEMIEGTTINLFYTGTKWEIATRNAIGGNYWFYRTQYNSQPHPPHYQPRHQITFLEMFVESLGYDKTTTLNDIAFLSELDTEYSYSFILQHPQNHIVQTFAFPHIFLVGVYKISGPLELTRVDSYPLNEFRKWKPFQNATMSIEFPRTWPIVFDTADAYSKQKADILAKCPMGIFLVSDKTGNRAVIENPNYTRLRELRGNNPNLQYQFLCMYYIGKVEEFIENFPMYKHQFYRFMKQYRDFVSQVQDAYYKYYVCKSKEKIPKRFFIHAAAIHHSIYIPSIKPYNEGGKIVITKKVVDEYFKKLGPQKLIYYVNYLEETDESTNN